MRHEERLKLSGNLAILATDVLHLRTPCDSINQQTGAEAAAHWQALKHLAAGVNQLNDLAAERVDFCITQPGNNDGHIDLVEL